MSTLFTILKSVINNGGLPLTQVTERIETMYLSGRLNAEERLELIELMHANANVANEKGNYEELYNALAKKYNDLEGRVAALEDRMAGSEVPDEGVGSKDEYPAWELWDGVSNKYQTGAVVTHNGKVWQSMYAGQNVWEPGAPGIDERYWVEVR